MRAAEASGPRADAFGYSPRCNGKIAIRLLSARRACVVERSVWVLQRLVTLGGWSLSDGYRLGGSQVLGDWQLRWAPCS